MNRQEQYERKIGRMRKHFGESDGRCKNCSHFKTYQVGNKTVFKCEVYGVTHSTASDWRKSYPACGMFNKEWNGIEMMRIFNATKEQKEDVQIDGQISLFGE